MRKLAILRDGFVAVRGLKCVCLITLRYSPLKLRGDEGGVMDFIF